ncbi:MAG: cytochrome c [Planctomycetaceae bacterium]|nr:cytochrome c [Planctomycetaceae bacterium]
MKNLNRLNIVLGVLLAIAAAFAIGMDVDHTQPNLEFLPEMKRTPASTAFSASSVFPNGRTLQEPVAGTIPRGDLPLYYEATKEDAVRAGEELRNPVTVAVEEAIAAQAKNADVKEAAEGDKATATDAPDVSKTSATTPVPTAEPKPDPKAMLNASIQRGAKIYGVFCVSCHGPKGAGDGPVAKRGFPPPPPLPTGKSVKMKDGQLFHILTYGQGSMSSMAAQLNRNQRWDVINYVRSMQQAAADNQVTPPAVTEPVTPQDGTDTDTPPNAKDATDEASQ